MNRLPAKSREQLSEEQLARLERMMKRRKPREDGRVGGPFDPWLLNPELFDRNIGMGLFLSSGIGISRQHNEIAILTTAAIWQAQYEFIAHKRQALKEGVPEHVIEAIRLGDAPNFENASDQLVYDIVRELNYQRRLSPGLYRQGIQEFGEAGLMELVTLAGFYVQVSMTLNTFNVSQHPEEEPPFPVLPD